MLDTYIHVYDVRLLLRMLRSRQVISWISFLYVCIYIYFVFGITSILGEI